MKRKWSSRWASSRQPRKQRKHRINAPLHKRRKMMSAHLSIVLRKELGRRSVILRKNDEVKIMRGSHRKSSGKITRVDMRKMKIYVENVKRKKASGQEVDVPIEPSNVVVTRLYSEDKARMKYIRRGKKPEKKDSPEKAGGKHENKAAKS